MCIFSTRGESEKHKKVKKKILTLINYFLGFHINTAHHPRFHLLWNILICHSEQQSGIKMSTARISAGKGMALDWNGPP